ncbi:glycerol transporter [Coprinopsis sp. MPI-PUGE-AT-0042]|nr:glycerol transporter [Coprinopsis sp. MPI-PUGE-AT-0042]
MSHDEGDIPLPIYSPRTPDTAPSTIILPAKPQDAHCRFDGADLYQQEVFDSTRDNEKEFTQPAKWMTTEFQVYYLIAVIVIPIMVWVPIASSSVHYQHRDNSDHQYRSFRGNMLYLVLTAGGYLFAKYVRSLFPMDKSRGYTDFIPFNTLVAILTANYLIAKTWKGSPLTPLLTWVFNGGVLFANEVYHGYRFGHIIPSFAGLPGIYPRWHIIFNITMLRLISFNMDYYWARQQNEQASSRIPLPRRQATPVLGILTHRKPIAFEKGTTLRYLVRFMASFLTMEFILHFMYVVAIKDEHACMIVTHPLAVSSLWAMMDGILAPENMIRSWHRSYNLWIIRYIFIPLGGSKHYILNTLLVLYGREPWYRHVCAIGGVVNILMMMAANLVGFVIGTDGIKFFVAQLFGTLEGLMFEYRMRNGIYRRC